MSTAIPIMTNIYMYIPHGILFFFDEHCVWVTFSHQSTGQVISSRIPLCASTHISLEIIKLLLKNLQCRMYELELYGDFCVHNNNNDDTIDYFTPCACVPGN